MPEWGQVFADLGLTGTISAICIVGLGIYGFVRKFGNNNNNDNDRQ